MVIIVTKQNYKYTLEYNQVNFAPETNVQKKMNSLILNLVLVEPGGYQNQARKYTGQNNINFSLLS